MYENAVITFFDMLGFKNLVDKYKTTDELLEVIKEFEKDSKPDPVLAQMFEKKFHYFSDTVIRTTNLQSKMNLEMQQGILFHEIIEILYVQIGLLLKGILIRGGLTIGNIYLDGKYIFGEGLNRGHFLEHEKAIYPRIVIDNRIFDLLDSNPKLLKGEQNSLCEEIDSIIGCIAKTKDGVLFLDYLRLMSTESDGNMEFLNILVKHKNMIVKTYKENLKSPRVTKKMQWLTHYHNYVVSCQRADKIREYGYNRDDIFISKSEIYIPFKLRFFDKSFSQFYTGAYKKDKNRFLDLFRSQKQQYVDKYLSNRAYMDESY